MSQDSLLGHRRLRVRVPLTGRDPDEEHRAATPLELFFDLVFVVAVALAAEELQHGIAEGAVARSALSFMVVFFTVYWAWVNFTWFSSAYDTDDLAYRLFVFVNIVGALVFAAGVPRAFQQGDFAVAASGYAVMRTALVSQWLRVARPDGPRRPTAQRYAVGLTVLQMGWLAALVLSSVWYLTAWVVLALGELALPVWAEAAKGTSRNPYNAEHVTERYGLFMIIVLGESVLAASRALQTVLDGDTPTNRLAPIIVGGLLIVFSIWWTYFERPDDRLQSSASRTFVWAYLHVFVFASVAALGGGLALTIEAAAAEVAVGPVTVGAAVAVPLVVYLLSLWGLGVRADDPPLRRFGVPVAAVLVLAAAFTPAPVLVIGVLAAGLVALETAARLRVAG